LKGALLVAIRTVIAVTSRSKEKISLSNSAVRATRASLSQTLAANRSGVSRRSASVADHASGPESLQVFESLDVVDVFHSLWFGVFEKTSRKISSTHGIPWVSMK